MSQQNRLISAVSTLMLLVCCQQPLTQWWWCQYTAKPRSTFFHRRAAEASPELIPKGTHLRSLQLESALQTPGQNTLIQWMSNQNVGMWTGFVGFCSPPVFGGSYTICTVFSLIHAGHLTLAIQHKKEVHKRWKMVWKRSLEFVTVHFTISPV